MPLTPPEYTIEHVSTFEALRDVFILRLAIFADEQRFPAGTEIDEYDNLTSTKHIVIRLADGTIVGNVRARRTPGGYYKLERLCVREDNRKYGFGGVLVKAAGQWALQDAASAQPGQPASIVCHAQLPVIKFYERLGYVAEGEQFDEEGAPHQKMRAQLTA